MAIASCDRRLAILARSASTSKSPIDIPTWYTNSSRPIRRITAVTAIEHNVHIRSLNFRLSLRDGLAAQAKLFLKNTNLYRTAILAEHTGRAAICLLPKSSQTAIAVHCHSAHKVAMARRRFIESVAGFRFCLPNAHIRPRRTCCIHAISFTSLGGRARIRNDSK